MQNIEKLKKVVVEGNHYGAQQMYKSVTARYENLRLIYKYCFFVV